MANSNLQGKTYQPSFAVIHFFKDIDGSGGEGSDRASAFLSGPVTYEQVKRLKHDIENKYQGDWKVVLNWCNNILGADRNSVDNQKRTTMDIGMENRFRKTHDKDANANVTPLSEKKVMKIKITEEQKDLLKETYLNEGENFSRYKASALKVMIKEKQDLIAQTKADIKAIYQILQSKAKTIPTGTNEL